MLDNITISFNVYCYKLLQMILLTISEMTLTSSIYIYAKWDLPVKQKL
jgi:hypothetical protein